MMENFLPFALPDIGEEEIEEVVDTLRSSWITTGPKVARFEQQFAEYVGAKHALAVNSCTAGLHLGLEAAGVSDGDLVITTPYTFTASAEVIRYLGADPVFVDVDPATYLINPALIQEFCEKECVFQDGVLMQKGSGRRVSAIVPVHIAGLPCDMDAINSLSERYGLAVIQDAAHSLPTHYKGRLIGSGDGVTAFSFYATKTLTTGEGGMVTTNDDATAERMKVMRLHGISHDVWDRYQAITPSWYYEVEQPGFKYNMSDISAAIGIQQLKKADRFHERRNYIAQCYTQAFAGLKHINCPPELPETIHAWHLYIVQINTDAIERDQFIEELSRRGIGASVHFIPLHIQPYYRDRYGLQPNDFPCSLNAYQRSVSLPIFTKMTETDINRVIDAVCSIFGTLE